MECGTWNCSECTYQNSSDAKICQMCDAPRKADISNKFPSMAGNLRKRGAGFLDGWQERYFDLYNGRLTYYKVGTQKEFGFVDVLSESTCQWIENLDFRITNCFMKSRGAYSNILLRADSWMDMQTWIRAINGSIIARQQPIPQNRQLDENEIANVVVTCFNENSNSDFDVIENKIVAMIGQSLDDKGKERLRLLTGLDHTCL